MKRMLLLGAVLLGAAPIAQAGVHVNIGVGIPLPGVVVSSPPVVYQTPAPVVYQAPPRAVVVTPPPPPVVYAPAPVVYAPAPRFYVGFGYGWWNHGHFHRGWHR